MAIVPGGWAGWADFLASKIFPGDNRHPQTSHNNPHVGIAFPTTCDHKLGNGSAVRFSRTLNPFMHPLETKLAAAWPPADAGG